MGKQLAKLQFVDLIEIPQKSVKSHKKRAVDPLRSTAQGRLITFIPDGCGIRRFFCTPINPDSCLPQFPAKRSLLLSGGAGRLCPGCGGGLPQRAASGNRPEPAPQCPWPRRRQVDSIVRISEKPVISKISITSSQTCSTFISPCFAMIFCNFRKTRRPADEV